MINPRQVRILVVDDESSIREVLATRFAIFGFQTVVAGSGEEAWQKISQDPTINIVVTDLSMPGMDGQELLIKCKSMNAELPRVFAITGNPTWSVEKLYALGAEGVLHKPFDARTLLNVTRSSLLSFGERLRYPPYATTNHNLIFDVSSPSAPQDHLALARGGFCFTGKQTLPGVGHYLNLDLNLGQMSLHGCGLVRWHRKEDKGGNTVCGVEFVHLKPESI
ncbi:MAG: response regulator, partial [Bdellovibrionales bacterium]